MRVVRNALLATISLALWVAVLPAVALASSLPPRIEGVSVASITEHDATLEAQINPNGLETTYQFNLTSPACQSDWPVVGPCFAISGFSLPSATIPAGFGDQTVRVDINSAGTTLTPGTWYEYAITASNAAGKVTGYNTGEGRGIGRNFAGGGGEQNFKTLSASASSPVIESESASNVTEHDATLVAQIDTNDLYTGYWLQIDTNSSYDFTRPNCPFEGLSGGCESISVGEPLPAGLVEPEPEYIPAGSGDRSVSLGLASIGATLQPDTTYHYRVLAKSAGSLTVQGPDQTLTTPGDLQSEGMPLPIPENKPTPYVSPEQEAKEGPLKLVLAREEREAVVKCVVPSLKGDTLSAARRRIDKTHCRLGKVSGPRGRTRGRLVVIEQRVRTGARLPSGAHVGVTLGHQGSH